MKTEQLSFKNIDGITLIISPNTASMRCHEKKVVSFTLSKNEKWDNWGSICTTFSAFNSDGDNREIYTGEAGINKNGEVVYISAVSPLYGVEDFIDNNNIHSIKFI